MSKPKPLNPNTAAKPHSAVWRELKALWGIAVAFLACVFVSAFLVWIGCGKGWGIEPTFSTTAPVSFSDCLHFSVVTIATLGYGDFRPVGLGRVVAAVEVITGMVLMGLFIARLVSRQQDRMTKRIVMSLANNEIQRFRSSIRDVLTDFKELTNPLQGAPVATNPQFETVMSSAASLAKAVARYWRHEARQPDLNDFVPKRSAARLLGDLSMVMKTVREFVPNETKTSIDENIRVHIRSISEAALTVADLLETRIGGEDMEHLAEKAYEQIHALRNQFALGELR